MKNFSFKYGIIGSSGKLGRDVNAVLSENGGMPVFLVLTGPVNMKLKNRM